MPKKQIIQEPDLIIDSLYIGDAKMASNVSLLQRYQITHIVNCASELKSNERKYNQMFNYLMLPMVDGFDTDLNDYITTVIEFIEDALENKGNVFIHCSQGISRSASILIAYLMYKYNTPYDETLEFVRQSRPECKPNGFFEYQLKSLMLPH
jgi:protein-tyrosine phosphatase